MERELKGQLQLRAGRKGKGNSKKKKLPGSAHDDVSLLAGRWHG
jgi:hypothetical protein